jgi:gas vesicle structural protein
MASIRICRNKINSMQQNVIDRSKEVTILELLDRVLNKGVVIVGDVVISVADIDLVYLGVKLLLSSVETMEKKRLTTVKSG